MSNNVTVEGVRIKNSPKMHFRFDNCTNVYVDSIRITSPALSPNTDGIHIENTDNAQIYNSVISTGTSPSQNAFFPLLSRQINKFFFFFLQATIAYLSDPAVMTWTSETSLVDPVMASGIPYLNLHKKIIWIADSRHN